MPIKPSMEKLVYDETIRHAVFLVRYENGVAERTVQPLRSARTSIMAAVSRALEVDNLTLQRNPALVSLPVIELMSRALAEGYGLLHEESGAFAQEEARILWNMWAKHVPGFRPIGFTPEFAEAKDWRKVGYGPIFQPLEVAKVEEMQALRLQGLTARERFVGLDANMRVKVHRTVAAELAKGKGSAHVARVLDRELGLVRTRATLIARTEIAHIQERLKDEMYAENADVIAAVRYTAALDSRTCLLCGPYDGQRFPLDGSRPFVPQHPLCRCTYVAVPKTWPQLGENIKQRIPEGVRPAWDYSDPFKPVARLVPSTTSWTDWFSSQDASFQLNLLGPTRYKIWKQGRLALTRFANDGRILTLNELSQGKRGRRATKQTEENRGKAG